ncbi:hypothetical protein [Aliterella atlantica]|uniref:hypothetical protein n=1 Tax=Aliterella atlantica TaxID=1827278 RepID=UPI0005D3E3E1|nr:hypothetical protein [Aliterella atlantica]
MKNTAKLFQRLVLGTVASIGVFSLLLPQSAWAQSSTDVNPLQDFQNNDQNNDPFSSRNEDSMNSVFDLIHRAQLGTNRDASEFNAEKTQSLDAAAAEFRKQQQQRLQSPNQTNNVNPPITIERQPSN